MNITNVVEKNSMRGGKKYFNISNKVTQNRVSLLLAKK
jgi:hypothetical protein